MKKNLLLLAACGGMLLAANDAQAQETVVVDESVNIDVTNVECKDNYNHSWRKNWFIEVGAGAQLPFVEDTRFKGDWHHQITAIYNLGFGHWWSPYFGFRMNATYGAIHWDSEGWGKAQNVSLNAEIMWDMLNSICGYSKTRVFSIIPFVGFGGNFSWDYSGYTNCFDRHGNEKTNVWTLPVTAGIQLRFRLCKYVDFFAEGRYVFYSDEWNRNVVNRPLDINAVAVGGFNFNIGGREFTSYNPCEYIGYINALNNQVNDLRAALASSDATVGALQAKTAGLEAQLDSCRNRKPEVVKEVSNNLSSVRYVFFRIGSAVITADQQPNVEMIADYLKNHPQAKVIVKGYASPDGNYDFNVKLAAKRAESVKNALVSRYKIAASRIDASGQGIGEMFSEPSWNRVSICTIEESK